MKFRGHLRIGDMVTLAPPKDPPWDGTVVDVIEDYVLGHSDGLYRVYWRYPLGKVHDYRSDELEGI